MAFELRFAATAVKQPSKLDSTTAARIVDYLEPVAALDDPPVRGKDLTGEYRESRSYGIGDYRALGDISRRTRAILTLAVRHRSQHVR